MSNVTAMKPRTAPAPAEWLSPSQVCDVIPGMTVTLLQRMRDAGKGPRYAKPSAKTVVYSRSDVDAWVRSTLVTTRAQS
ncbi:helix-turn-helix domain-containing protein [Microbacterium sp. K24]|uniref:helix-turn-helix transcriptional regulator n=1 Tax=Microbacterium sp. K24 TaxID=2305446 RepID=UPI00109C3AB4|nr:helix-turn-helix domain-containing protein [Microbacterium sp. K24]